MRTVRILRGRPLHHACAPQHVHPQDDFDCVYLDALLILSRGVVVRILGAQLARAGEAVERDALAHAKGEPHADGAGEATGSKSLKVRHEYVGRDHVPAMVALGVRGAERVDKPLSCRAHLNNLLRGRGCRSSRVDGVDDTIGGPIPRCVHVVSAHGMVVEAKHGFVRINFRSVCRCCDGRCASHDRARIVMPFATPRPLGGDAINAGKGTRDTVRCEPTVE
mmetsp:Transcript_29286/g.85872  ORF Transcript_29286/g.85872 Transcript_29286/m.85872 type:complete len:222 (-) Transcript_29286:590-1255(-)